MISDIQYDRVITFNNGLDCRTTQDKIRQGGSREGVGLGDVLGRKFFLRRPDPFLKSDQIVMCLISHG